MGFLDALGLRRPAEARSIEDPRVPISDRHILAFFGLSEGAAGEAVTIDSALGVPAVWDAVNFLSGTLAGLPLHLYRKTRAGRERVTGEVATMLHDAASEGMSSFDFRKYFFDQVFTQGRGLAFIERTATGRPMNLWPLDPLATTVKREGGRKRYAYKDGRRTVVYEASEVIDLPFMLKGDGLAHRSPILANADVIGLAQALTKYGAKFFANGGVPPFVITGPFKSPGGLQRSAEDMGEAIRKASGERRLALSLPEGHDIKPLGMDPEKSQMIEAHRFIIEQIARIYQLPPTFLQDLSHGTYSNTEQQDLHFTKHTVKRWAEQFEQEMNLKLFGRSSSRQYVELNLDGLLRGDFKTRMEGYSQAVQHGIVKPSEIREMENWPVAEGSDKLFMQGAMMPIDKLGQQPDAAPPPADAGQTGADDGA